MRRSALFISALLALACSNPAPPPQPAAFDRPESLAFFCWSFAANDGVGGPVALSECAPAPDADPEGDAAEPRAGFALHALVTQTATGEVAAVRLSGENSRGVIDSDVRVPGFTFVEVGEVPVAMAISEVDPKHVFVASRGSGEIHAIATADFRGGKGVQSTAFSAETLGLPTGARPSSMVLSPTEDALILTLPTHGQLARVPILGEGQLGDAELVDLTATLPAPVDLTALGADPLGPRYEYTCPADLAHYTPPIVAPRDPVVVGAAPEPWSILYDEVADRLFVADRSLPIIHVLDPATMTEEAPIAVSVPTRLLAVTPFVPATTEDPTPTQRYLYAIDDTDGSVLAVDLSDPSAPTYGAVLPVSVAAPVDRLALRGDEPRARALAVVSPGYDPDTEPTRSCADAPDELRASGSSLWGVFLTVGTADGAVRFFDVHDLDIACRGSACDAENAAPEDQLVVIGRHRPRIGVALELDDGPKITPAPTWTSDVSGAAEVDEDGTPSANVPVPVLQAVECEQPLGAAFPITGTPRICGVVDPWVARTERFRVAYEGQIPFTATTGGNFEGERFVESRSDFCALGVIGALDAPTDGFYAGYEGDVVAITGDLPPSVLDGDDEMLRDRCTALTQRTVAGETTPIRIRIERAFSRPDDARETYPGRLELGAVLDENGEPSDVTLDQVRECFPELLELEVRAGGAFVVSSSLTGFTHPVVRRDDGVCVVDPARVAEGQLGRVRFEQLYDAPRVRFALGPAPESLSRPVLEFEVGDVPFPLSIDVSSLGGRDLSSLLTNLVYNDVDERLYAIDQDVQGLLRIQLNPSLGIAQAFR